MATLGLEGEWELERFFEDVILTEGILVYQIPASQSEDLLLFQYLVLLVQTHPKEQVKICQNIMTERIQSKSYVVCIYFPLYYFSCLFRLIATAAKTIGIH